jgi:uncharacterized protein (TIGR00725 family)
VAADRPHVAVVGPGEGDADLCALAEAVGRGMGELRNGLVVRTADALIAVGGGHGTLSEIALALKAGKPVVGLGTWQLAQAGVPSTAMAVAADPRDATRLALEGAAAAR